MKKLLLAIVYLLLFLGAGQQTDFRIVVHDEGGTIIKVRRDCYYEYLEQLQQTEKDIRAMDRKYYNDSLAYERWEHIEKYENRKKVEEIFKKYGFN